VNPFATLGIGPQFFRRAALAASAFCMLVGLGVAAGWLLEGPALLPMQDATSPMTFNAALCFVLSGMALVTAITGRRIAAGLAAGCMLALGNVTLLGSIWARPAGFDRLFTEDAAAATAVMSPQLALCFIGTSVAVLGFLRDARASLAATVSSLVAATGVMSMLGHGVDLEPLYGWSGFTRMAFQSALTVTVLSAGLLCVIVADSLKRAPGLLPEWLHVPVGVFTGAGGLILWHATTSELVHRQVRPISAGSGAMLLVAAVAAVLTAAVARLWVVAQRRKTEVEQMHLDLQTTNEELRRALSDIKTLSGLIPICAWCKSIRGDKGYWEQLEQYLSSHADVLFTHGICPTCSAGQIHDAAPETPTAVGHH
jgi:hypothetical protein